MYSKHSYYSIQIVVVKKNNTEYKKDSRLKFFRTKTRQKQYGCHVKICADDKIYKNIDFNHTSSIIIVIE
ncbi:hypothetical protein DXB38_04050 [Blautia obeum]|uniref:Uncharacterized protein n=2 Tax=Blautia obeum TaxID=40520 RepID=A5ZVD1_9FIRM|nr:hypothetical protein RUMOBE_02967 [Blautia obeum ATCC 29174]RGK90677.1 hypothetical protein DXC87_13765 [Blautia obeum]RGN04970.1 hypothetical protein DXB81_09165 [Blautia obeum]RGN89543.1 hypothetical protein DXB38_04050 [Blautia obeum]RGS72464.1 hypothetical protein DWX77_10410 [Blautia obeum]